jgi:hypothetical protein
MPWVRGLFLNQQNNRSISEERKKNRVSIYNKRILNILNICNQNKGIRTKDGIGYSHISLTTILLLIQDSTIKSGGKENKEVLKKD